MAESPAAKKAKQVIGESDNEELNENEAEKSLDDFLRDTNELVCGYTEDGVKSPASLADTEGEL